MVTTSNIKKPLKFGDLNVFISEYLKQAEPKEEFKMNTHVIEKLKHAVGVVEAQLNTISKVLESLTYKKQTVKRPWMNYKLPKVLMDATSKRGFTKWKDLTAGSRNGFRHKILLWSLPKVNNTYKKRIKTILNQYYV